MKFVDECTIRVVAGKGGNGGLSFRREKYVPRGGPDGGDGGRGGNVTFVVDSSRNTLVDFLGRSLFRAGNGKSGMGKDRSGAGGADIEIAVPAGTTVVDAETGELIADLTAENARMVIAAGGDKGLGNARFKSSTNRAPRRTTEGTPGEERLLRLQLRLLADVGLLGFPNAGKSSLIRQVSAARPKVADYPFTTMVPQLGVVSVGPARSFVMADIPGLIPGAAMGAGLGTRFLKHLSRTRLLLHIVDAAPLDGTSPADGITALTEELVQFSPHLAALPRWLVLNKRDLLLDDELAEVTAACRAMVPADQPIHVISSVTGEGVPRLAQDLMVALETLWAVADEDARRAEEAAITLAMAEEMALAGKTRAAESVADDADDSEKPAGSDGDGDGSDDSDDGDDEVSVEYRA